MPGAPVPRWFVVPGKGLASTLGGRDSAARHTRCRPHSAEAAEYNISAEQEGRGTLASGIQAPAELDLPVRLPYGSVFAQARHRMYLSYSLILGLAALLSAPYWIYRAIRERKYFGNFRQRLGLGLPPAHPADRPVWIHAVSVGEVLAAKPLCAALRQARPDLPIVVSTVTIAGQALARKEFPQAARV